MSLAITTTPTVTAGTKQFGNLPIHFIAYQTSDKIQTNLLYTANSTAFPTTTTGTGSITTMSSSYPLSADKFETIYNPANTSSQIPLVGTQRDYVRFSAGGTASGTYAKTLVNWDMTLDNWFTIVVKSSGTSVAGKVKLRSSGTNERIYTFTTNATANTWEKKVFDMRNDGTAGVGGEPVWASITEVEVTLDTNSTVVDFALVYGANNISQIIGEEIPLRISCVSEASFEDAVDQADLLCNQQTAQKIATGRSATFKVASKKQNLEAEGLGLGDIIKMKKNYFLEVLNDTNVGNKSISAGAITLPASLKIASVFIEGQGTLKAKNNTSNLDVGAYNYNSTTGVITFNTGHDGKVPVITILNLTSKPTVEGKNLETGLVGWLQVPRNTESGKYRYLISNKAQLMLEPESFNDDGDQLNMMFSILPYNGIYFTKAQDL